MSRVHLEHSAAAVADAWNRISRGTFDSLEWYETCCRADRALTPLILRYDDIPRPGRHALYLLPLAIHPDGVLRFASAFSDYNDVVGAQAAPFRVARTLVDAAFAFARARGLGMHWDGIAADTALCRALERHDALGSSRRRSDICLRIELTSSYGDWFLTRSRHFRSTLRRAVARADVAGLTVAEERFEPERARQLAARFVELHLGRIGPDSDLATDHGLAFVRELFLRCWPSGRIRVFTVVDRQLVVGIHVVVFGERWMGYWNGGFDAGYAIVSPGNLMFHREIRCAIESGLAYYDLLRGAEAYKARWANGHRSIYSFSCHPGAGWRA